MHLGKSGKTTWATLSVIALVIIVIIVFVVVFLGKDSMFDKNPGDNTSKDWETYTSNEWGFEIQHPSDWVVFATRTPVDVRINIYPLTVKEEPPFIHHSNVPQVSIFPEGVPTEGVFGELRQLTDLNLEIDIQEGLKYILKDGQPWAYYINPAKPHESWQPWGFIWASVDPADINVSCERGGQEITMERCEVLGGEDRLIRNGSVNKGQLNTIQDILGTFKWLEEDQSEQEN